MVCNKRTAAVKADLTEKEWVSADRININYAVGGGGINVLDIQTNKKNNLLTKNLRLTGESFFVIIKKLTTLILLPIIFPTFLFKFT